MKNITIVGAGLAGTLLAIYLAKRGYDVDIFESRPDIRLQSMDSGRSINLAMSYRGISGLAGVGLMPLVDKLMVPMRARAIHEEGGEIKFQSFGRNHDEYINSIVRQELNCLLLDEAQMNSSIHLHFGMKLLDFDLDKKTLHFACGDGSLFKKTYCHLIGADGANSLVRETLVQKQLISFSRSYLPYGYKELSIAKESPGKLAREHLHLWPRDSFLLLGNPNRDDSITGSLFLTHEGKNSFAELDSEFRINAFFRQAFPDAYTSMPYLIDEFLNNPTGKMSTIKCAPWYYQDNCLLIGDAAHGIVPFFGQGMNSAFEDCRILNDLLTRLEDDWTKVMPAFYASRKINTDAVAEMSLENCHEIQTDIRNDKFNLKKQIEKQLMQHYPNRYISKHVLVMFTNTPYADAYACGQLQGELLNQISSRMTRVEDLNWQYVDVLMNDYDKKLAKLFKI